MVSFTHDFEAAILSAHDELYASSNIRTPEELQEEFAKVFFAVQWGISTGEFAQDSLRIDFAWLSSVFAKFVQSSGSYTKGTKIFLDGSSAEKLAQTLSRFDLGSADRDWLGDSLEVFRSTAAKRLGGQFFTDQRVTELALSLLGYDPDSHSFADTCAGTGGFLIAAAKTVSDKKVIKSKGIFGVEIDAKLAHLAKATLKQISPNSGVQIFTADSLKDSNFPFELGADATQGGLDMIASNPPFGIKITIKDPEVTSNYELSKIWTLGDNGWEKSSRLTNRPPDILFLERNLNLVKKGTGRIALVLPYQILSGPRTGFVREWLLRNARILAVIDLPDDTFQPWTGTKTSLLIAERRLEPLDTWVPEPYPIFMAVSREIGHDRRGKPVLDDHGFVKTDLPTVLRQFREWSSSKERFVTSPLGFEINAEEISNGIDLRLNAAFFSPDATKIRQGLEVGSESGAHSVHRLGDLVESVFCPGRFKRKYVNHDEGGIPFLGGSNVMHFVVQTKKFLASDDPNLSELIVEPGWLLVTRSGSTGIVSSVPTAWAGFAFSEHVIRIKPKKEGPVSAEYIEAYLRSELGQKLLAAGIFGSVIDEITPEQISELPVPVPKDHRVSREIVDAQRGANQGREAAASLTVRAVEEINRFHAAL